MSVENPTRTQAQDLAAFKKYMDDSYTQQDPVLSEQAGEILWTYSGIPKGEQVEHVKAIRAKGWEIYKYPCIGRYRFISFAIGEHALYPEVLQKVKNGATLLDLGCCFAQDIRKLVFDGAPSENLTGSELQPEFIELGYDLFKDKETLKVTFKAGDFFAPEKAGLVDGSFDFIHAASFLHLFSWDEQVEAATRAVRLLKQKAGSAMFGRQIAGETPEVILHPMLRSGEMYRHNQESFERMVQEVGEKVGMSLKTELSFHKRVDREDLAPPLIMRYSITIQ